MENVDADETTSTTETYLGNCPPSLQRAIDEADLETLKEGIDYEFDAKDLTDDFPGRTNDGLFFDEEVFDHLHTDAMGDEDDDSDSELSPFEKLRRKMEDITPDGEGGVWKQVVNHGTGPKVARENRVQVHYNSYLEYNDEPMDSTRLRNETKKFILGRGDVIEGMDLAVSTMKQGELSKFLIAPDFAFGQFGCGQRIPPNSEILMEIELVSFSTAPSAEDFVEAIKKVRLEKEEGNRLFKKNEIRKAESKYVKAQRFLGSIRLRDEEDEKEMKRLMLKLSLNIALTSIKLGQGRRTISQARRALDIEPNNDKALYRLAKGFRLIKEFDRAEFYLNKASKFCPNDYHINKEKQELAQAKKEFSLLERESYSRMFNDMNINDKKQEAKDKPTTSPTTSTTAPEFQKSVTEELQKFLKQPDTEEMPTFQLNQMSEGETTFVETKAKELGLEARYIEKMGDRCLRIGKKKKSED